MKAIKKLTERKAIELTWDIYSELARTGDARKIDVECVDVIAFRHECPLCEYVARQHKTFINAIGNNGDVCERYCPVTWPARGKGPKVCFKLGGLWTKWNNAQFIEERKTCAADIAVLMEKHLVILLKRSKNGKIPT